MITTKQLNRRSFMTGVAALPVLSSVAAPFQSSVAAAPASGGPSSTSQPLGGVWIDLAGAQPSTALDPTPGRSQWQSVAWKAQNGDRVAQGTMLLVGPESHPPELVIDPQLTGPHEIFVGLPSPVTYDSPNPIRIKLDNDPSYRLLVNEKKRREPAHEGSETPQRY